MTLLLIIFAIATFVLLAWVIMKMEDLDDYQDELDKYSVHLDERANKLAKWEQELMAWEKERNNEKGLA